MITAEYLRRILRYDPDDGTFTWIAARPKVVVGARAGSLLANGYWHIKIDGRAYKAHRLAWLYMSGEWPPECIDHINGNKSDNRFANLRIASISENQANTRLRKDSSVGLKGVTFMNDKPRVKPWLAQISKNKKKISLGCFSTPEEAHEAYLAAAVRLFGQYARAA